MNIRFSYLNTFYKIDSLLEKCKLKDDNDDDDYQYISGMNWAGWGGSENYGERAWKVMSIYLKEEEFDDILSYFLPGINGKVGGKFIKVKGGVEINTRVSLPYRGPSWGYQRG